MSTRRLSRLAMLANRAIGTTVMSTVRPLPTMSRISTCQLRKITSSAIVREQYLHGYKDDERFHGI